MYQSTQDKYRLGWNRDFGNSWSSLYWVLVLLFASLVILVVAIIVSVRVGLTFDRLFLFALYPSCLKRAVGIDDVASSCSSSSYIEDQMKYKAECNNQKRINKLLCKPHDRLNKYVIRKTPDY